jgi:hypothetical protein
MQARHAQMHQQDATTTNTIDPTSSVAAANVAAATADATSLYTSNAVGTDLEL